jgi:hypothetical protein
MVSRMHGSPQLEASLFERRLDRASFLRLLGAGVGLSMVPASLTALGGVSSAQTNAAATARKPWIGAADTMIDINPRKWHLLSPGFSGFNNEDLEFAVSFRDLRYQQLAASLEPGWYRFSGGAVSDVYDWQTGDVPTEWVNQFTGNNLLRFQREQKMVRGRGGVHFDDYLQFAATTGARTMICFNAFTDTPESAGKMAQYVKDHDVPVIAWELANEAFFFPRWFHGGTDYVEKMRPYAEAIRAVIPDAIISLAVSMVQSPKVSWDEALANYPHRYWDAVSVHHYAQVAPTFEEAVLKANYALEYKTAQYYSSYLLPKFGGDTLALLSEFHSGFRNSPICGTLYDAIYTAEYIARESAVPNVKYVGLQVLYSGSLRNGAIQAARDHEQDVIDAYEAGTTIDTTQLDFGFFLSPQGLAMQLVDGAVNDSSAVLATTLEGPGTVPADTPAGIGNIPALHAQAYRGGDGRTAFVLITNKSETVHTARLSWKRKPVRGPFQIAYITGDTLQLANTETQQNVGIKTAISRDIVHVPRYSIVRVEWSPTKPHKKAKLKKDGDEATTEG